MIYAFFKFYIANTMYQDGQKTILFNQLLADVKKSNSREFAEYILVDKFAGLLPQHLDKSCNFSFYSNHKRQTI